MFTHHIDRVNEVLLYNLQCFTMPSKLRHGDTETAFIYDRAYDLWRSSTREMLEQLQLTDRLNQFVSDDFLLFDHLVALFYGKHPVAILMYELIDLHRQAFLEQHYLSLYPPEALQQLRAQGRILMVMGNFCVHPDWRQSMIGPGVADLLTSLVSIFCYLPSTADNLAVITRNNRKTNELAYRHGGQALVKEHAANNCMTDIIVFPRDKVHFSPLPGLAALAKFLWQHRIDCEVRKVISSFSTD